MKLVELLEAKGFIPDFKKVKEVEESLEEIKRWSRLKGYQIYRGKRRYPIVVVNPFSDESFWDYKRNFINIGILSYGAKAKTEISLRELVLSLLGHELSHTENTPLPKETWSNGMMTLFNILEDQRIETLMSERIGREVFEKANKRYYELYYEGKKEPHLNPFNLVILKRWERWGVKVNWEYLKEADGELKEAIERGFLEDTESTLIAMEGAEQDEAVEIAEAFYQRWRNLFESEAYQSGVIDPLGGRGEVEGFEGLSEEAKEEAEKQLEEVQSENPFGNGNDGKATPFGGEKRSRWLTNYSNAYKPQRKEVEKWKRKLRKLFKGGKKVKERAWVGSRIDPKVVISGIPKPPSWRKREKGKREKVAVIIDGSASMAGNAFQEAVNIAQAIKELSEDVEIFITTSEGLMKTKGNNYPYPGGGTALTVAKPYLKKGYRIAVITDGLIDKTEREFLKEVEKNKGLIFFV